MEYEKKPCLLCNDTGFVMESETDVTSEAAGKPEIFRNYALDKLGCKADYSHTTR
jgi:hypothetical protein